MKTPIINDMQIMFRSFSQTSFKNRYPSIIIINSDLHPKLIIEHNNFVGSSVTLEKPCDIKFCGVKIIRSNDIPYIEMY